MRSAEETLSAEDILYNIGVACLLALDPCLTREQLAQRVKDIYTMADLRGDGMDLGEDDDLDE